VRNAEQRAEPDPARGIRGAPLSISTGCLAFEDDDKNETSCEDGTPWSRLGGGNGARDELAAPALPLREPAQDVREPRPPKDRGSRPANHQSPFAPLIPTTRRVSSSSGHGQKCNISRQVLLMPGYKTDSRAN
jgi:hypothetical protein